MAIGTGFSIKCGMVRKTATNWGGNAASVNAKRRYLILNESISQSIEYVPDDSLNSTPWRLKSDVGNRSVDGNIEMYGKYTGLEMPLFCFFGGSNGEYHTITKKADTDPAGYYFSFSMKDNVDGYYATIAIDKIVTVAEFPSVKFSSLTISGESGTRAKFSFGCLGDQMVTDNATGVNGVAIVNTVSNLNATVEPTPRLYMMMSDAKFRIGAQNGGAALGAADSFYPSAFSVTLERNMGGIHQASGIIDEPAAEGFSSCTGTFSLPTYKDGNEAIETAYINGTKQRLAISFQSSLSTPIGSGNYYYAFKMYFPEVLVTEANRAVAGPGRIPADFAFEAFKPSGAYASTGPDGMDGNGSIQNDPSNTGYVESRTNVDSACVVEILNRNEDVLTGI